jgi:hypothetical protein
MPTQITNSTNSESKPSHSEIAKRAEAIFEESGRIPGRDMQNWLEAEAQLLAARKRETEKKNANNNSGGSNSAGANPAAKPSQRSNNPQQPFSQRS